MNPIYEISWYGAWWLLFVGIAYTAARYFGRRGVIIGTLLLAIVIYLVDCAWISADMKNHPEHGRDMDFIFFAGVAMRVVFFNVVLLPVTLIGLRLRVRRLRVADDKRTA